MHRYPVSPTGVSLLVFFYLFKVSKIIFDLFKVIKITCDSFKVCEMTIFNYSLFKVSDSGGKWSNPGNFLKARFVIFGCQKVCKKRVHRNDNKNYLETLKSVLGRSVFHYCSANPKELPLPAFFTPFVFTPTKILKMLKIGNLVQVK